VTEKTEPASALARAFGEAAGRVHKRDGREKRRFGHVQAVAIDWSAAWAICWRLSRPLR
jgi:hypothetical protein